MKCAIGTRCEKCGSTNITKELIQSYSMGKGLAGQAIFGAGGTAMGVNGKQEYIYNCQDCGHTSKNIMDMYTNSDIQKAIFDPTAYASLKYDLQSKYPNIDWSGNDIGVKPLSAGEIETSDKHFKIKDGHLIGIDIDYQMVMTKAIIPNGVTHIEAKAFMFSTRLKEVVLPAGLISIGDGAFSICEALVTINLPSTVKHIGNEVFSSCKSLRYIYIPKNVETIGKEIFKFCNNKLTVKCEVERKPKGWHKLWHRISSMYLFINEYANVQWGIKKQVETQPKKDINNDFEIKGNILIRYRGYRSKSVVIPNGVTTIGKRAFDNHKELETIILPNSVTSIGVQAFFRCVNLTKIDLPDKVVNIDEQAFSDCSGLTSVAIGNSVKNIGSLAFGNCSKLKSTTIPKSVTDIGEMAFQHCDELQSLIWNAIDCKSFEIGAHIFSCCGKLTSITFGDNVKTIPAYAFCDCSSITSVTLGNNVTSIGECAFNGCKSLTNIILGNSVTSIGESTFFNCNKLTSITIPASVTSIGINAFFGCSSLTNATFINKENWVIHKYSIEVKKIVGILLKEELNDTAQAAKYLTDKYCYELWTNTKGKI